MNLNKNLLRLDKHQEKLSTGKKFNVPSDDPIGVSKSLELNTALSELEQYKKNSDAAASWLEITEDAVATVGDILHRARELAVSADGIEAPGDKEKIRAEIDQLRNELIKIANTAYAGKYIFSGYHTNESLLKSDGTYNIDIKNNEIMKYMVGAADEIEVNTLGHKLFGIDNGSLNVLNTNEPSGEKAQLVAIFDALSAALSADDKNEIQNTLTRIDIHMENVLSIRAEIGAKTNRMELTSNRIDNDMINFTKLLSKNEDADLAEVIMQFKNDENVYRASLSTGAKAIQPSLIDFIR